MRKLLLSAALCVVSGLFALGPAVGQAPKDKKKGGRPGEVITPAAKGERIKKDSVKTGDPAPDFTLPLLKGDQSVTLSSFKDKRPVVLIFGSYT